MGCSKLYENELTGTLPTELSLLTLHFSNFQITDNAGLCGTLVPLSNGLTEYSTSGTNLGTDCPTSSPTTAPTAPTSAPTVTTAAPTAAPTVTTASPTTVAPTVALPCCEVLRENPIFCCLERINAALFTNRCQECGTK